MVVGSYLSCNLQNESCSFYVDCSVFFEFLILPYSPSPLCHVLKFTIWWIPVKLVQIPPCSYWLLFITWELTVDSSVSSLNSNEKINFHEIWKRVRCSSGKIMLIHLIHNIILCYSKSLGSLLCTKASEPNIEPDWLWNSYQHKPSVETYIVDIMSQNCYMVLIFLLLRLLMVQNWFCYK